MYSESIDMELLKEQILEAAVESMRGIDERYIEGWVEGVLFTCDIFVQMANKERMLRALATMPIDGKIN